jgi:hypothetical protein
MKARANDEGVPIKTMYDQAVRTFLDGGGDCSIVVRPDNRHWHRILELALADIETREGITANLRWADTHIHSHGASVVNAERARRDREFADIIASMEILRNWEPSTPKARQIISKIIELSRGLVADIAADIDRHEVSPNSQLTIKRKMK